MEPSNLGCYSIAYFREVRVLNSAEALDRRGRVTSIDHRFGHEVGFQIIDRAIFVVEADQHSHQLPTTAGL